VPARLVEHGQPLQVTELDVPAPGGDEAEVDMLYGGVNLVKRYRWPTDVPTLPSAKCCR